MDIEHLLGMANRIGQFFEAMPDAEVASTEIALHIRKFWEPRMRRELLAHLDEHDGHGLSPIVKHAVQSNRAMLDLPAQTPR